jgi:heterodisulfide reductase subunit A2
MPSSWSSSACATTAPGCTPMTPGRHAQGREEMRVGVARARHLQPYQQGERTFHRSALVIGGGPAGMTAALSIADEGYDVFLVEKTERLGGYLRHIQKRPKAQSPAPAALADQARSQPRAHRLYHNTEVIGFEGHVGNFRSRLSYAATESQHDVGRSSTASRSWPQGGSEYKGHVYLYGQDPRVITQLDLEKRLAEDIDAAAAAPGGHDPVRGCTRQRIHYCSRTCCTNTMKNAIAIKRINPDCQVYVLYKDLITYGFREQYYTEARERGVLFLRYDREDPPQVQVHYGELQVRVKDHDPQSTAHVHS